MTADWPRERASAATASTAPRTPTSPARRPSILGRPPEELNLVTLHLGNGASAAAVAGGRSVDTSMGLTPLEGLVMGTRSGDLDPAVVFHLHREAGLSVDEIDDLLNKRSGLLGLRGANDMREVDAAGRRRRRAAVDGARRLLPPDPEVRRRLRGGARPAGRARLHRRRRRERRRRPGRGLRRSGRVSGSPSTPRATRPRRPAPDDLARDGAVAVLVVPTNEELEIAEQTLAVVGR